MSDTPVPKAPAFVTQLDPKYGELVTVAPGIRRIVANNPSKFTYLGTGTYVIGEGQVAIIDCGPRLDDHVAALLDALSGEEVTHLLVTHTHGDHSPSTEAVKVATGATTYGFAPHPENAVDESEAERQDAEEVDGGDEDGGDEADDPEMHRPDTEFVPDVVVGHGDRIAGAGFTFEALHTPGHISNHLCFSHLESNSLFSGDHVMGWSTTIIPPPDGDMGDYLHSLRLLLDRDEDVYYPTHGPAITEPRQFVQSLLDHRLRRESQILDLLNDGPLSIPEIVAVLYAAVDKKLHKPAARSVESHLVHLERQNRVTQTTGETDESGGTAKRVKKVTTYSVR